MLETVQFDVPQDSILGTSFICLLSKSSKVQKSRGAVCLFADDANILLSKSNTKDHLGIEVDCRSHVKNLNMEKQRDSRSI